MKIRIKSLILYILIIFICVAFGIVYEQPVLLILVFAFILLVILSFVLFKKASGSYEFNLNRKSEYVEFPNEPGFIISYKRNSRIPLFNADFTFSCENRYFPNDLRRTVSFPLVKKDNQFVIPLRTTEIGLISLYVKEITLQDYFNLFFTTQKVHMESSVPVIPVRNETVQAPMITPKEGTDEYVESDSTGNVSSDVKEIREYRPGDRLQRIHWKLSAKLDDLFVKEMANTSTLSIVLLPELEKLSINDTVATLVSISDSLMKEKTRFEIAVFNSNACEFTYLLITNEEELLNALTTLFCQPLYETKNYARDTYNASHDTESTIIQIQGNQINIGE